MQRTHDAQHLDAARMGDQEAFRALTDPYRRELLVHCYRMLGSLEEAEDMLQETLFRAWRRLQSFEGRATLRRWLYTIATNVSLDALDRQRVLPTLTHPPADPSHLLPAPTLDHAWLEPLPETLIDLRPASDPVARYEINESVTLAFMVALQALPGRQRAVLLLRDVLGWHAREVAELLDMSVVAVNSALQRARTTLQRYHDAPGTAPRTTDNDPQTATLLARYVAAWEAANVKDLIALLREDAVLTMPPLSAWYAGRAAIAQFLASALFGGQAQSRFRLIATRANSAPAFAVYQRDTTGMYRAAALQVVTIAHDRIERIDDFLALDDRLFARFALPLVLDR